MNIGIIGTGLIGASVGRAVLAKTPHRTFGRDVSREALDKAFAAGAFTGELDMSNAADMDVVFVCVRPSAYAAATDWLLPLLKGGAVIADCCGTKRRVAAEMARQAGVRGDVSFVATHPMAGREFSGAEHSTATLFENCFWIFCPIMCEKGHLLHLEGLVRSLGTRRVVYSTPEEHDRKIAYTSQMCHVLSNAYIKSPEAEGTGYTAGSFRDLSRVARLDADMWTELFFENSDNLLTEIDFFSQKLAEYRAALADGDGERLRLLLAEGSDRKNTVENAYRKFIKDGEDKT